MFLMRYKIAAANPLSACTVRKDNSNTSRSLHSIISQTLTGIEVRVLGVEHMGVRLFVFVIVSVSIMEIQTSPPWGDP